MARSDGVRAVTVPAVTAGNSTPVLVSACRLYGWSLADAGAGLNSATAEAAFIAGANGTATLPVGASITGFDLTWATFAVSNVVTVTVTGATGGTLTFDVQLAAGTLPPGIIQERFPLPLTPANPAVAIAVTWTGNVNSPAGHVIAYGETFQTAGQILDGGQILGSSTPVSGASDTQWLADKGIYVGTGISVKCVSGSISGCIYILDGTEIPADGM